MRRVTFRVLAVALLFLFLGAPAMADEGTDAGIWAQFTAWINGRIGIPNDETPPGSDSMTIEEWLVLMGRIGIPN